MEDRTELLRGPSFSRDVVMPFVGGDLTFYSKDAHAVLRLQNIFPLWEKLKDNLEMQKLVECELQAVIDRYLE